MILLKFNEKVKISYIWIPISILFLIGGFIQYIGLISLTQTNILVLLLLFPFFLYKSYWAEFKLEVILLLMIVYCIFVSLYRGFIFENLTTYIYYIACTIFSAVFGRFSCNYLVERNGLVNIQEKYIFIIKFFLFLQLFICFFQNLFTQDAIRYASIEIIPEDIVSGTMYLKSDAALATITQLIMISIFFIKSKLKDKILVTFLILCIIYLGNSKAAQAIVVGIAVMLIINFFYRSIKLNKFGFNYLFYLTSILSVIFWIYFFSEMLIADFVNSTVESYQSRDSWYSADRLAPIGQFFYEGINFVGNGPLTYYNPNTKVWLYNSGFSTFYSLYIDLGLVGLLLYLLYYLKLLFRYTQNVFVFTLFFIVLIGFSQFNFTLSDIAFAFSVNFIMVLVFLSRRKV